MTREAAVAALARGLVPQFATVPPAMTQREVERDRRDIERLAGQILDALSPDDARAIARALPGTLDAAWAAVEAVLPEGWAIVQLHRGDHADPEWFARGQAGHWGANIAGRYAVGIGPTPAAALLALVEKLR